MNLFKKAAVCLAATSMIAAPVAASAAPAARAASTTDESELEGGTSWVILALAAVGLIVGIVLLTDGNDSPTSP